MLRTVLVFAVGCALFASEAQEAKAPPKKTDTALRERVSRFYQAIIDGKFQQAEQLVAAESKNFFVGSNKPNYASFEVKRIEYTDDFHQATVTLLITRLVPIEGFAGHPVPGMIPSHWKIEHGKWCWYVTPTDVSSSPFGQVPKGGMMTQGGPVPGQRSLPVMPNMAAGLVTADKTAVTLKSGASSAEQVTISNKLRFPVTLSVMDASYPGVTVSLDQTTVKPEDKGVVRLQATGGASASSEPVTVRILVRQINQIIPIKVSIAP